MTRSGNEAEFRNMVYRCNKVGVRIYVDVILNHMTGIHNITIGTGGSIAYPAQMNYPFVPYNSSHFNYPCTITDSNDPQQLRNCELLGLKDLNQSIEWVRARMVAFLDNLIEIGVAGFRLDAAKHMWPTDLEVLYCS